MVTLVIDQLSKALVRSRIDVADPPVAVLGFLDLRHVHNRGVAFSMLSGRPWLIIALAMLVLGMMVAMMLRTSDRVALVGIGAVLGGAVGNIIDRVRLHHVTDFLHVPHWPTFNVADAAICVGVGLIVIRQWQGDNHAD